MEKTRLHYRPAARADIPAMSAVRLAVSENRLSDPARITEAMYIEHIEGAGRSWVCEAGGAILGFASAATADGAIWALFVDPAHEGRGIGKHLLALAAGHLFAQGHDSIVLATAADTRADVFYASQGWERGKMKNDSEVAYSLRRPAR